MIQHHKYNPRPMQDFNSLLAFLRCSGSENGKRKNFDVCFSDLFSHQKMFFKLAFLHLCSKVVKNTVEANHF